MSSSSASSNPRPESACGSDSRLIDVTSNAAFRPFSLSKRIEPEVQEQLNLLKKQMEGKEDFTASRSLGRNKGRPEAPKGTYDHLLLDMPVTREQTNHYRVLAETARSELAALHVKFECAQTELLDLRTRLNAKEVSLHELKSEVESYKENNARQSSLISSLRGRVQEMDEESGLLATSKTRAEMAVQAVLQENQEMKEKIQEEEARVKKYITEWEASKSQASRHSRNYGEFVAQLAGCMEMDIRSREEPQDTLISKVSELREENAVMKGRIVSLEETINVHEMEAKASRETIMRLVSEVNREQKKLATYAEEMETLRKDLDSATEAKQSLERESRILQDRVLANQRAWEASKQELVQLKRSSSELDESLRSSRGEARVTLGLLSAFKDQVAELLSSCSSVTVKPSEEAILERIHDVLHREESKKMMISQLETQITKMTEQLQTQMELHQEALQQAGRAELQLEDARARLARLEGELVSGDMLREGLSMEKQKYLKFLEELSDKMKLEWVAADVGFDMRLEAVLGRAEQLVRLEGDAVVENKTLAHGLQRKLKSQKEKLESKELHMSLLRKKIAQLEEEKQVRTALAVERDDANLMVRKLQKRVERLQRELNAAQESSTELRARLSDTNELKIKTLEQNKAIEELSKSLERVEKVKEKAQKKLVCVKSELDVTEKGAKEEKEKARSMLEALTSELSTLKKSLDEIVKRERQLVDFREVVSRLLGLNVNTLALPDYEIIKRLERLVHIHQHHVVTCA
ncbi:coiled-coil domain-containing protein 170-like isoform X1 [Rhinatrema bivittatum]|uniref:coiled-coil domain-containing protein 170-like isoform X1 n=1 Tax=Rhinatrema bivittatum TaxID=194408 RepID=UPI001125CBD7|nr:coiled-coil domain-containing protein 170-like isoform X1 [Rhinatrema bivittatum]